MDSLTVNSPEKGNMAAPDVLKLKLLPLPTSDGDGALDTELDGLLKTSLEHFQRSASDYRFVPEKGVIRQLEELLQAEPLPANKRTFSFAINNLRAHFNLNDPEHPEANNGRICLYVSEDKLQVFLTLTPPRPDGDMPTISTIQTALAHAGIVHGLDEPAMERALETVRSRRDVVWCALIARGVPPVPVRLDRIEFKTRIFDKPLIRKDIRKMEAAIIPLWKPLHEDDAIGVLKASNTAAPGKDVFGQPIPPPPPCLLLDLSEDVVQGPNGTLKARAAGYVVTDGKRVDIMPLYFMDNPAAGTAKLSFPGVVLVRGHLRGPGAIECDDLFIVGNCEQVKIVSRNDVFISGGIVGHNQTELDADGGIYASFISEAKLSALGEVIADNAIINSQVISGIRIRVLSPKGMIAGGTLMALREIAASTIGSEFGMLTQTVVGKDFLSSSRIEVLTTRIRANEDNLRRIQELKQQLAKSRVSIENMPPEKQEIYIGILRKEQVSQTELKSLVRRKKTLNAGLQEFLDGSVKVVDNLFPPVRVQIGDAIKEFRERLNAVTLTYNKTLGIVSRSSAQEQANPGDPTP
ncbi:MAG: DUF342 domain-containing protein [Lentisphaerae bacterium]|nr:DUF342 domain-containing protein [Lentisphaerota bacterium]